MDPKDTLEILQLMAGTEYLPEVEGLTRQPGLTGGSWEESDRLTLRERKKASVEEVQKLQEGESITLFRGEVLRGNALYIKDYDKFSKEDLRINRFIGVSPPTLDALLSRAPARVRRSFACADKVQQILQRLDAPLARACLPNLVLTDPVLATLLALQEEWQHVWQRPPRAGVRTTLLWETAQAILPQAQRYKVQARELLAVGMTRLAAYQMQHVGMATRDEMTDKQTD